MFYCLVVGSRSFDNYELLESTLDKLLINYREITIVSGGAKGADTLAEEYAAANGYECMVFKANWQQHGRAAGIFRNEEMHRYISQFEKRGCGAVGDGQSRGTYSNFELAKKYNNPLRIIRIDKGQQ